MAHHHRSEAVVVVDQLVAIDVDQFAAVTFREVERVGVAGLEGRRHAERHRFLGPLEQSSGLGRQLLVTSDLGREDLFGLVVQLMSHSPAKITGVKLGPPDEPSYSGIQTFQKVPFVRDAEGLQGADVVIVGAPMDEMVTHRPGTRFGPRAIRGATDLGTSSWHMDLGVDPFQSLSIVDHGDALVRPGDAHFNHRSIRETIDRIVDVGAVPVVLGGDHSIAFPDIAAVAERLPHGSLAVVQFDTHADTATENYGVEWSHGTPFRHLVDQGVIPGERLIQIGLRGGWPYPPELVWARTKGVRWHRMEQIIGEGIDRVTELVVEEIGDAQNVFLSVDIDVLDPAFAPGTGTPEPGGLTSRELLRAVRRIVLAHDLAGMDVVEVSPPFDHSDITALAAHRVVIEALSALALRRRGGAPAPENP